MNKPTPRQKPLPSPTRIFIVDDHPLMRESLSALMEAEEGMSVVGTADTADAALAALRATPADLVLVDIRLRDSSGLAVLQALDSMSRPIRAMVVSMHEEPSIMEAAFRNGARAFVNKAESPEAIASAVKRVIAGELLVDPRLLESLHASVNTVSMAERIAQLSEREREVFLRLGTGQATRDIATEMGLGVKTVQTFCARIKDKLSVDSVTEIISEAARFQEQQASGRAGGG